MIMYSNVVTVFIGAIGTKSQRPGLNGGAKNLVCSTALRNMGYDTKLGPRLRLFCKFDQMFIISI